MSYPFGIDSDEMSERIRELEDQLSQDRDAYMTDLENMAQERNNIERLLEQRIQKAREILEQSSKSWRGVEPDIDNAFQMALAALEGK